MIIAFCATTETVNSTFEMTIDCFALLLGRGVKLVLRSDPADDIGKVAYVWLLSSLQLPGALSESQLRFYTIFSKREPEGRSFLNYTVRGSGNYFILKKSIW